MKSINPFKKTQIKIINRSANPLPEYKTPLSSGLDLIAYCFEPLILKPAHRKLIPTGLFIEMPQGIEAQVRPRSGLALKYGITVLNSPGTIDADYRGEIKVLLINHSNEKFIINNRDRIAQIIFAKHETIEWEEVEILNVTKRGDGGYGHTGK